MLIEIINWEKYNPKRSDCKSTSWLRLENTFWQDHKFFRLDNHGKMVWIALLSAASTAQTNIVDIDTELIGAMLKITNKKVLESIEFLEQKQCVRVQQKLRSAHVYAHVTDAPREREEIVALRTNERTNERNERTDETIVVSDETNITPEIIFDAWNKNRTSLPEAKSLTTTRRNKILEQFKKSSEYKLLDHWLHAIKGFTSSDFCLNEWRPGFDDLLDEGKRMRAIEGKYDGKRSGPKTYTQLKSDGNAELMRKVQEGVFNDWQG